MRAADLDHRSQRAGATGKHVARDSRASPTRRSRHLRLKPNPASRGRRTADAFEPVPDYRPEAGYVDVGAVRSRVRGLREDASIDRAIRRGGPVPRPNRRLRVPGENASLHGDAAIEHVGREGNRAPRVQKEAFPQQDPTRARDGQAVLVAPTRSGHLWVERHPFDREVSLSERAELRDEYLVQCGRSLTAQLGARRSTPDPHARRTGGDRDRDRRANGVDRGLEEDRAATVGQGLVDRRLDPGRVVRCRHIELLRRVFEDKEPRGLREVGEHAA